VTTAGADAYLGSLFGVAGKTVLVTGGGQGIGRMIAEGFVRAGARVHIASRKAAVCAAVAEELSTFGTCIPHAADLSTTEGGLALAAELEAQESSLHVLVNNAGATWGASYDDYPAAAWSRCMDLNVHGVFELTRACTPLLAAAGTADDPARVVNIGSVDGIHVPVYENYAYAASKAALHHLSSVLAARLAPQHITVNTIAPGPFASKMMAETLAQHGDELVEMIPLGRIGRPDDIAGTTLFLASRAGAYLTGAVLPLEGGLVTTH
jgi:NAD(P)-dependent dehydrogenase (short-subunit alcohol dehydrogenase family)